MFKGLVDFFKEIFKNDVGIFRPEAKKPSAKWIIYWIFGVILSIVIPTCLVYLEAGQFRWNVFTLIWEDGSNYLYRVGYFLLGLGSNILFLLLGYLNTYHINGDRQLLDDKKVLRVLVAIGYSIFIVCFIIANIMY